MDRVNKLLGMTLSATEIVGLLTRDHLQVVQGGMNLSVTPPTWRFDIAIEEDLIEEVARLYGYDNIPVRSPLGALSMLSQSESKRSVWQVRHALAARGFQEVINFAFVEAAWERDFCENASPIRLANPIASQMGVMRSSLIPGLVSTFSTNRKRQNTRVRVFEVGRVFERSSGVEPVACYSQPLQLAALVCGSAMPVQWGEKARSADFFDLKADVEALLAQAQPVFEPCVHPALHPGRSACVKIGDKPVGMLGELHPQWIQKYDLGNVAPIVFELDLDAVCYARVPSYQAMSRQPIVARDLALVVDQSVNASALLSCLKAAASDQVVGIELFDLYQGKGVAPGKKSLAFNVLLQDTDRTLEDQEVDLVMSALCAQAAKVFGAQLRGETSGV